MSNWPVPPRVRGLPGAAVQIGVAASEFVWSARSYLEDSLIAKPEGRALIENALEVEAAGRQYCQFILRKSSLSKSRRRLCEGNRWGRRSLPLPVPILGAAGAVVHAVAARPWQRLRVTDRHVVGAPGVRQSFARIPREEFARHRTSRVFSASSTMESLTLRPLWCKMKKTLTQRGSPYQFYHS